MILFLFDPVQPHPVLACSGIDSSIKIIEPNPDLLNGFVDESEGASDHDTAVAAMVNGRRNGAAKVS